MTRQPIWAVDWNRDFLPALAKLLLDQHGPDLSGVVVVFPHKRPARYLAKALAGLMDGQPLRLPRMLAVGEVFAWLDEELADAPSQEASLLDRAGILMDGLAALDAPGPLAELAGEPGLSFPWCVRLAELCEEFLRMGLTPTRLDHVEEKVPVWASALLARLGELFAVYVRGLENAGLATPGLCAKRVADRAGDAADILDGNRVYFAGFHILSTTERTLFLELERRGYSAFVLHTDPALATGGPVDASVRAHAQLHDLLLSDVRLLESPGGPQPKQRVRFIQAYDLHSQLAALAEDMGGDPPGETAVVIPDTGLLVPVLHHLPERDVNVSMGYPLERTALYDLVDTVCRLCEQATDNGFRARDLRDLLRHPYLRLLAAEDGTPLRPVFAGLEEAVLRAGRRIRLDDALELAPPADDPRFEVAESALAMARRVLDICLSPFAGVQTLAGLAQALERVADLLLPLGTAPALLLEAEALERLVRTMLPELESSRLSRVPFPPDTLFAILRQTLASQRIPFEAEPLTGLQVLGMLETRLLSFRMLYVLQATEDQLPGPPPDDPLLPDGLRRLVGLPDGRVRDQTVAYTLMRLIHASQEAVLLYPSGAQSGGLLDSKAVRSRYVEQLLWDEEQRQGALLTPGDEPLDVVRPTLSPLGRLEPGAPLTDQAAEALHALLARPLSPTLLDAALACPLRFYYRYLTPLQPPENLSEDGDPAELGQAVHDALADFLRPKQGMPISGAHLDRDTLAQLVNQRLESCDFMRRMAFDTRLGLKRTLRSRLDGLVDNFPATTVAALEQDKKAVLDIDGRTYSIQGRMDRVDQRGEETLLLDYKTGKAKAPLARWLKDPVVPDSPDHDSAAELADGCKSLQMPMYLWLLAQEHVPGTLQAAWVELGAGGTEKPYFPAKLPQNDRAAFIIHVAPRLMAFAVHYLRGLDSFPPRPSQSCRYCDFTPACDAVKPKKSW